MREGYSFPGAVVTEGHKLSVINNRNLLFHSLEARFPRPRLCSSDSFWELRGRIYSRPLKHWLGASPWIRRKGERNQYLLAALLPWAQWYAGKCLKVAIWGVKKKKSPSWQCLPISMVPLWAISSYQHYVTWIERWEEMWIISSHEPARATSRTPAWGSHPTQITSLMPVTPL